MKMFWLIALLLLLAALAIHWEPRKVVVGGERIASIAYVEESSAPKPPISSPPTEWSAVLVGARTTSGDLYAPGLCYNTIGMPISCGARR